jgi:predicted ArsR family transcriptional regulator
MIDKTRLKMLRFLQIKVGATSREFGEIDIIVSIAKRYLDEMICEGLVKLSGSVKTASSCGRPARNYVLTQKGRDMAGNCLIMRDVYRYFTPRVNAVGALNEYHPSFNADCREYRSYLV